MLNKSPNTQLGFNGEDLVCEYLERQGFRIVTKNHQWRGGELDIVAERDDVLAFVEVKTRERQHVSIAEMVPWSKQQKIVRTAQHFINKYPVTAKALRFDVAFVCAGEITYIPNAFTSGSSW